MKSYRKLYKEHFNVEFGKDYEIHHIDGNRENNNIENLLLLPRKLHQEYHKAVYNLKNLTDFETDIPKNLCCGNMNGYIFDNLKSFMDISSECQKWVEYKAYLRGQIPNIHHISLGGDCE